MRNANVPPTLVNMEKISSQRQERIKSHQGRQEEIKGPKWCLCVSQLVHLYKILADVAVNLVYILCFSVFVWRDAGSSESDMDSADHPTVFTPELNSTESRNMCSESFI